MLEAIKVVAEDEEKKGGVFGRQKEESAGLGEGLVMRSRRGVWAAHKAENTEGNIAHVPGSN